MAVQAPILKCIGIKGFCEGEVVVVKPGRQIIVGRSRSCEFSLRRAKKYMAADPDARDNDADFQTVSRQHVKLSYVGPEDVRIEDLSSNGTFVAGERISAICLNDLTAFAYDIQLGTRETLRIQIAEDAPVKRRIEPADPPPAPADAPASPPPTPAADDGVQQRTPPPPPKPEFGGEPATDQEEGDAAPPAGESGLSPADVPAGQPVDAASPGADSPTGPSAASKEPGASPPPAGAPTEDEPRREEAPGAAPQEVDNDERKKAAATEMDAPASPAGTESRIDQSAEAGETPGANAGNAAETELDVPESTSDPETDSNDND